MNIKEDNNKSAFTLVELAIVLIIIGLITGGVVGAQSLVKSADRQSTIRDISSMRTAIRAFQLEYDELPGVMQDAYDYFGDDCGGDNSGAASGCNGESTNDGCIDSGSGDCNFSWTFARDMRRAFVHLNLSGIAPNIPYINSSVSNESQCRNGIPSTAMADAYLLYSESPSKVYMYLLNYASISATTYCIITRADALTPKDAKYLDSKIDDGIGNTGIVQGRDAFGLAADGLCHNSSGIYDVSLTDEGCQLRIKM